MSQIIFFFSRQGFSVALEPVLELALVDQAGLELPEIRLPLPPKCWCTTTAPLSQIILKGGEVFAICGSCDALGNWNPQNAVTLLPENETGERVKLTLEGLEEDDDDKVSPTVLHKMSNSLEISLISDNEFKCRHSQPECGYGLQPDRWTEYSIQTMEPDNLELIFDFFEEDLSEHVVQGDALPGHVGTACLLSSTIAESEKSAGVLTLPIMSRISRKTIGKVRVDFIIIKPLPGYSCSMQSSFSKYWKPRIPLDVGHRGAGNSTTTAQLAKVQENTIASLRNAASHGAAFVEFDVHLSKDFVPVVYHDLTCCLTMKRKFEADPVELFEIPVKELTFDQLQLLKDGVWDGNLSTYFDMNQFLDIILKTVLENSGKRRIVFSSFDADICTMVRQKQNKYPILFLTQGKSDIYPELMDLRSRTTPIAMSFAQFENILGINAHTEDLLRNPSYVQEAKAKGLVIFCWGDDTNDPENRRKLKEFGVNGLIYDRIYDWMPEQPNIFQVEQLERLKQELPELKNCLCPSVGHFVSSSFCGEPGIHVDANGIDNVETS
ncbi:Glycerophosphocholine phosphodiesterase GPCPD1 [Microtus ochrogaster]|uniref:Glycerophosphocholine phosphodiesterase GPCPD1 n=1 Tax=Microtus ochrogaster TaxID=79684 RepID=A0A8J6L522_MICOH|nr:Glycerophosphocholine phosphodiesterase GPCPD1 [Microtus ochrogaster]